MSDTTNTPATDTEILPSYVTKMEALGIPKTYGERMELAYRVGQALLTADMIPSSLVVYIEGKNGWRNKENGIDQKATVARAAIAILKGFDVGMPPVTAVQNIMVVNNKPCIYGDGGSALVQSSGLLEWQKVETTGSWAGKDYVCKVTMKRIGQSEPYIREFTYKDAEKANLHTKKGPWLDFPTRQCYWRAWSWCARDGFSDALNGLAIAEELRDIETEDKRREPKVDTSDLGPAPAQIQHSVTPTVPPVEQTKQPEPVPASTAEPQGDLLKELGMDENSHKFKPCGKCGGSGRLVDDLGDNECPTCKGAGDVPA